MNTNWIKMFNCWLSVISDNKITVLCYMNMGGARIKGESQEENWHSSFLRDEKQKLRSDVVLSLAATCLIWQKQVSAHHPSHNLPTVKPDGGSITKTMIKAKNTELLQRNTDLRQTERWSERSLTFNTLPNQHCKLFKSKPKAAEPEHWHVFLWESVERLEGRRPWMTLFI